MLSFTLVIPTKGRTQELNVLFESLVLQQYTALHCIVIDQNHDDRLNEILNIWSTLLNISQVRAEPGVSHARNLGLQLATGDVIAFPDDDCWYSPSLLHSVAAWFQEHMSYDILTVGARDMDGIPSGNRWIQRRCEIRASNAFRTTFCSSIFLRRSVTAGPIRFDELIGPGAGTRWSCGEETDYILNLLRLGARGFFDSSMHVGHPRRDMLSDQIDNARAEGYGSGMGYILHKHKLRLLGTSFVAYDLLRSLIVAAKGDWLGSSLCFHHARGIVSAWMPSQFTQGSSR